MKKSITLLFFSAVLVAQAQTDNLESLSLEELLEMEVSTATKSSRKVLEIPVIIDVITKEQIQQRGYQNLGELMNDLRDNNTDGYNWGIGEPTQQNVGFGFRFDTKQNMLFLFNGHRINAFMPGNVFGGEDYLLNNIERIEIIRGPGSAIYGPNAFTSVVNIITKSEQSSINEHFNVGIAGTPTSQGMTINSSVITNVSDGTLSTAFRYQNDKGQLLEIDNSLFGNQQYRDGMPYAVDGNLSFHKDNFLLSGRVSKQSRNTFTGFNGVNPDEMDELRLNMYAYSLGASQGIEVTDKLEITMSAGWHQDNWTETSLVPLFQTTADGSDLVYDEAGQPLLDEISIFRNEQGEIVTTSFFIDGQGADTRTLDAEMLVSYDVNETNRLTFGFNGIHEKVLDAFRPTELYLDPEIGFTPYSIVRDPANNWLFDIDPTRSVLGLYGQYEFDIIPEQLFLNVGGRFDKFSGTGVLHNQDYTEFNPKAGLVYFKKALGTLKVVYGTATRVPNGFETLSSVAILGNPENSPERLTSFQFQWEKKFTGAFSAELGYFNMRIENKLETNADLSGNLLVQGFIGQFVNVGEDVIPQSSGINGELKVKITQVETSLNFTQFLSTDDGVGNRIAYIPETMINGRINVPVQQLFNVNLGFNYRGRYTHPKVGIDSREAIQYRIILNLHAHTRFEKLNGFVKVQNLLNTRYNYPSSSLDFTSHFPARGIQISAGLDYSF